MKLKSSILILALLVSMFAVAMPKPAISTPDNSFYLSPDPAVGNIGAVASIDVKIDAVSNLNGYEFDLIWDRKVLKYKGITWGWLEDTYTTTKSTSISTMGNELAAFEGFDDPEYMRSSLTPQTLATVSWDVIAGGETDINFTRHYLWTTNVVEIASTADDGSLFTEQPYVDFSWSPSGPRIDEVVTYDASASKATEMVTGDIGGGTSGDGVVDSTDLGILGAAWGSFEGPPPDSNWNVDCDLQRDGVIDSTDLGILGAFWGQFGNYITGYGWIFDGVEIGSPKVVTHTYTSYSKTAHNVTLVVTDSEGDSTTLTKMHTVNRDISMFSIWPSMEDYQGSIEFEFVSGKYVVILVRYANIGTITEYTNNIKGDFPATAEVQLYLIHSDGTEAKIYSTYDGRLRRYWNYTQNAAAFTRLYDWAPLVGVSQWKFWDLWGAEPETDLRFKANFTDTATGLDPFIGDTDLSNNELWFGPFDIVAGSDHDIRIEGIYEYDDCGYYLPVQPYGTTFKYGYGQKFLNPVSSVMGPFDPIQPGMLFNVTVDLSVVSPTNETVTYHVYAGDTEIYSDTVFMSCNDTNLGDPDYNGYYSFEFSWDTTGFYGTYTLKVYAEPVAGETGLWATWDNNTPENYATYGLVFFNAYDDWVIQSSFP